MMKEDKEFNRRSIRHPYYDYTQNGGYFVTLCTRRRTNLFGKVVNGEMKENPVGRLVRQVWFDLPKRFSSIMLDEFVVMPNHIHGIIFLVGAEVQVGAKGAGRGRACPAHWARSAQKGAASSAPTNPHLGDVIRVFKSISAIKANRLLSRSGETIWQRNYFEHVIRDENSLNRIRNYIYHNPLQWDLDSENPLRIKEDSFDSWLKNNNKAYIDRSLACQAIRSYRGKINLNIDLDKSRKSRV